MGDIIGLVIWLLAPHCVQNLASISIGGVILIAKSPLHPQVAVQTKAIIQPKIVHLVNSLEEGSHNADDAYVRRLV